MIYLDSNATTRPADAVVEAMNDALKDAWQNPSSMHRAGQGVRRRIELARQTIADFIGATPREIVFTSGGTESIHLALRGCIESWTGAGPPVVITTALEHSAIRDLLDALESRGLVERRLLALDAQGVVIPESLSALLDDRVALVSVQWANNETGAIQPVERLAEICRSACVTFHSDGTQWVGKMPTDMRTNAIDLLTFSAHKFHGPKGAGALYIRRGARIAPQVQGEQELGRRAGTENTPGILGFGAAASDSVRWLKNPEARARQGALRDQLENGILSTVPGAVVNGPSKNDARLWSTSNIGFPNLEAEALLMLLSERGLCASAGAACSSGSLEPSPVLLAMGIPEAVAHGSVRFSLSRETTADEIQGAIKTISECALQLRSSTSAAL